MSWSSYSPQDWVMGLSRIFFKEREYVVCGPYECISGILDLRVNPSSPGLCFYDDKIKAHHHSQFILDLTHLIDICWAHSKCQSLNKTPRSHKKKYYLHPQKTLHFTRKNCHIKWQCLLGCACYRDIDGYRVERGFLLSGPCTKFHGGVNTQPGLQR